AMVGGPGLLDNARHGAIDMTRATRSPGSTLKPLIYGLAFDRGMAHPETLIEDKPARFGSYKPRNFNEGYRGTVTIREALAASLNIPAVKVLDRLGPGHLVGRLAAAGIRTDLPDGVAPDLAIALGGIGTDLRALTSLYAALANRGEIRPLRWHASAPDAVLSAKPRTGETRILSAAAAYDIARILRSAPPPPNARGGRIAFKTGTSYGHRDAWAVGFDGAHVIGVWVGRADGTATPDLAGREAAAPILFDAFHRTAKSRTPLPKRPNGARRLSARDLPPPLKRFGTSRPPRRQQAFLETPLAIAFPLDRTEVAHAGLGDALPVTAEGGALPLTWLVDGRPIAVSHSRRTFLNAATTGFVEISVVDADGQTARASVRLLAE
ncbi:MAG: penicillin-binding transpeptidase domain-containing protein, partial [Pseudomonadota bacterium]